MFLPGCFGGCIPGCSKDDINRFKRKKIEYLDGNYDVTYANGNTSKTWHVIDGKVTSESKKGYYHFWATKTINGKSKKMYVQTPIENTFFEQVK